MRSSSDWRESSPDFLSYLADLVSARLVSCAEIQKESADAIGADVMRAFCEVFGGSQVYVPKVDRIDALVRHDRIRSEFNGRNHAELARLHRVSLVHVYRILRKEPKPIH